MKRYYIYDRYAHSFLVQIEADSEADALKLFANEMKLTGYIIVGDILRMENGYRYQAMKAVQ